MVILSCVILCRGRREGKRRGGISKRFGGHYKSKRLKEHLKACLGEIRAYAAEKLKLEFNEKTQLFPVSEGVDYLGWRFYLTDTGKVIRRLRTSNKRRFKRRLRAFQKRYRAGELELEAITRSLASYNGHLKHGHTWKLKAKVYGSFVLTKDQKEEPADMTGETLVIE